jgi:hypothetical protein
MKKTSPPRHQEHKVSPRKHDVNFVYLGELGELGELGALVPWCLGGSHFLVD